MSLRTTNPAKQDDLVYLFSSVPPNRPQYKLGVLNALSYPTGHLLELSYRKTYFASSLLENRAYVRGRPGVFVFLDYKPLPEDFEFIPIRHVKVLDISPKEPAQAYQDSTRFYVRVELGELISFEDKWNVKIKEIPGRPCAPKGRGSAGSDYYYVLEGRNPFQSPSAYSQRDIWDHLTEKVAAAKSLKDCVFLSVGPVRPFAKDMPCELRELGTEQKAYRLRPSTIYRMDLRVFDPGERSELPQEIHVRTNSDLFAVSEPYATTVGGPVDRSVLIACKRTIEATLATLLVDVQPLGVGKTDLKPPGPYLPPDNVNAARPLYLLAIAPPWWVLWAFVACVFIGLFLTSTSAEFYQDFFCRPAVWALASKVIGAVFLAVAAYLAFRKLPSGGPIS
jgi:hypothetical protein